MEQELIAKSLKALTRSESLSQGLKRETFAVLWAKLCAAYPRQETTGATAELYFERLLPYVEAEVVAAIGEVIDESKFFPSVAEIIECLKSPARCIHHLELAQIRSRETMLIESEKHSARRLEAMAVQVAELEGRRIEAYKRDAEMIEESGLGEARRKLAEVKAEIIDQQRVLTILRTKVKLLDQARILQAEDREQ